MTFVYLIALTFVSSGYTAACRLLRAS